MGSDEERKNFVTQVRKACAIAKTLNGLGIRKYGVVRIDSAASPSRLGEGSRRATQKKIAETFRQACDIAEEYGERLAAEGEICWGGMHSWKRMVELLEMVDRPKTLGFQADMAHTLLFTHGLQRARGSHPARRATTGSDRAALDAALKTMTDALRPWTIDFHVAQNDATVKGSGSHDKTGRHCLPNDPNGKLDIVRHAGVLAARRRGQADAGGAAHLLGRLHVPERDDDAGADVERHPRRDDRRARRARVGLIEYGSGFDADRDHELRVRSLDRAGTDQ